MSFDPFCTVAQAAKIGLGNAQSPTCLIKPELTNGERVTVPDRPLDTDACRSPIWPRDRGGYSRLVAVRTWLACEMLPYKGCRV